MNSIDKKRDPREETEWEVGEVKRLSSDSDALRAFWEERYKKTYGELLEGVPEFGRHGVLAEYISRIVTCGRILDVGCGTGILSELLDSNRFSYEGIDLSSGALEIAKCVRSAFGGLFRLSRFEEFDTKNKYDAIVLNEVLYYLDVNNTLQKCRELLKGESLLLVSIFDFKKGHRVLQELHSKIKIIGETIVENHSNDLRWYIVVGCLNK